MTVTVLLPDKERKAVLDHARSSYPEECCGLIIGQRQPVDRYEVSRIIKSDNVSTGDRTMSFEIDPALLLRTHRELRGTPDAIIGYYHSHPDGPASPSETDRAGVTEADMIWLITSGSRTEKKLDIAAYVSSVDQGQTRFAKQKLREVTLTSS